MFPDPPMRSRTVYESYCHYCCQWIEHSGGPEVEEYSTPQGWTVRTWYCQVGCPGHPRQYCPDCGPKAVAAGELHQLLPKIQESYDVKPL